VAIRPQTTGRFQKQVVGHIGSSGFAATDSRISEDWFGVVAVKAS
jgi:hypothetical protein